MKEGKIKVAIIGLGNRGFGLTKYLISKHKDVDVVAVCDAYEDRAQKGLEAVIANGHKNCIATTDYTRILDMDIDAVFILASWNTHVQMAISFMKKGVYVGMEVGGAYRIEDCYDLVRTYEETGTPCMMLENCCYGKYELAVLGMVKRGIFGDVVHCEGGYKHDLRGEVLTGDSKRHYRLEEYKTRNCENYPTHEIGPIAKVLNINNGNRFVSLVSFASPAKGLNEYAKRHTDQVNADYQTYEFKQGDVVTTMLRCANGETVTISLDTSLPRTYSRSFTVCGTKARYQEDGNWYFEDGKTSRLFEFLPKKLYNSGKKMVRKYYPEIWKAEKRKGIKLSFHGGMDGITINAFLEAVRREEDTPIDVYDAATYMAITPLSDVSIREQRVVEFPDFTSGNWQNPKKQLTNPYRLD